mmetsp:Transcript_4485/g.8002  ORF Transcript_4485/g.8002 Transcript_4485/m.8002 type:complete len:310 (-) Transcript_4485:1105-2034(-)
MRAAWQELSEQELEEQFNPRVFLGASVAQGIMEDWRQSSVPKRDKLPGPFSISYGTHALETLDVHRNGDGSVNHQNNQKPLIIFIHGGYWRAFDKSDMDGHIVDLYERGWHVINVNYPLCPSVSLSRLYVSLERAIQYSLKHLEEWKMETDRIFFMGHSVGAHAVSYLAPRFQAKTSLLKGVVAVSGIYDIRIVQHISVQTDVRITDEEATKFNLLNDPPTSASSSTIYTTTLPILVVSGGNEPPLWIQQSELYATKLLSERSTNTPSSSAVVISGVIPNTNHFSVLDEMVTPGTSWSKQLDDFVSTHG